MMNPFLPKEFLSLPEAIWVPRLGPRVFRGAAAEIVLQMASMKGPRPSTVKLALRHLVEDMSSTNRIRVKIPWEQPEAALARAFLRALLQAGLCLPVPSA